MSTLEVLEQIWAEEHVLNKEGLEREKEIVDVIARKKEGSLGTDVGASRSGGFSFFPFYCSILTQSRYQPSAACSRGGSDLPPTRSATDERGDFSTWSRYSSISTFLMRLQHAQTTASQRAHVKTR